MFMPPYGGCNFPYKTNLNWIVCQILELKEKTGSLEQAIKEFLEKFDSKLDQTVKNQLTEWLNDGTLNNTFTSIISSLYWINVKDYGAKGDAETDDTEAIKRAQEVARSESKRLYFPKGTYVVATAFTSEITSRQCNFELKSNEYWFGDGEQSIIKNNTPGYSDILFITGNRVTLENLTINGNYSRTNANVSPDTKGISVWFRETKNCYINNLKIVDTHDWALRYTRCEYMFVTNYSMTMSGNQTNSDGFHCLNSSNLFFNNVAIDTYGDDGFAIESENENNTNSCHDIFVNNLLVKHATRSLLIFRDRGKSAQDKSSIYNVFIDGTTLLNAANPAGGIYIDSGGEIYNIIIKAIVENSKTGAYISHMDGCSVHDIDIEISTTSSFNSFGALIETSTVSIPDTNFFNNSYKVRGTVNGCKPGLINLKGVNHFVEIDVFNKSNDTPAPCYIQGSGHNVIVKRIGNTKITYGGLGHTITGLSDRSKLSKSSNIPNSNINVAQYTLLE